MLKGDAHYSYYWFPCERRCEARFKVYKRRRLMEQRIKEIVNGISGLPEKDHANIIKYLSHNEWGVALETLCAAIFEENIRITQDIYNAIRNAGKDMKMEPVTWEDLIPLIFNG